ncbi:MAG: metallophosphoesterase [Fimbriimonas ginsengisoli]|uniref:Metallophosphoesterase n=1 Tax=Fimbriimonas ginsengisoli TaxID=1005039 RepID=A0A931PSY2_FIMGI|nr:metallophosphoesterase [Fimbriimonas ginsengisoli]
MTWKPLGLAAGLLGAGMLAYGALVESRRLVLERHTLRLAGWPAGLAGFRIALLGDFHLRDRHSVDLGRRACELAVKLKPDAVAIVGDLVGYWKARSPLMIGEALEPLAALRGRVVAVPGNHDYWGGLPEFLLPVFDEFGIRLLRNEVWRSGGIAWVGIDSAKSGQADPYAPMLELEGDEPAIVLWHEPDAVRHLPLRAALMLSGHSHGGQFRFPGGYTPMHTSLGRRYVRGFYPHAPTPLYVTRGLGTTGPPSRFLCPPEVALLTLATAT